MVAVISDFFLVQSIFKMFYYLLVREDVRKLLGQRLWSVFGRAGLLGRKLFHETSQLLGVRGLDLSSLPDEVGDGVLEEIDAILVVIRQLVEPIPELSAPTHLWPTLETTLCHNQNVPARIVMM